MQYSGNSLNDGTMKIYPCQVLIVLYLGHSLGWRKVLKICQESIPDRTSLHQYCTRLDEHANDKAGVFVPLTSITGHMFASNNLMVEHNHVGKGITRLMMTLSLTFLLEHNVQSQKISTRPPTLLVS